MVIAHLRSLFGATRGAGAIAQTIVARFMIAAMNVVTGIISARTLSAGGRGEMSAMIVWPTLLAYLLTLGLPTAIRYWIRRDPSRRAEFFTVAVVGAACASIAGIGIGVAFLPVWLHGYGPDVVHGAQILMATSPEIMLGLIFTAMLETLGQFRVANATRYATVLLTLAALAALAVTRTITPFTGALAYNGAPVAVAFWIAWNLRSHFCLRAFDPRPAIRLLTSYGLRSYGIDVLNTIASQVDQVLVIAFLNATDVGIYVVALNASRLINIVHTAVVTVVLPTAAGLDAEVVIPMVERSARVSTLVACSFGGCLALILPVAIPLLYGKAFANGVVVAQILCGEAVLSGLASVLAQSFMAIGRPGVVTVMQGVGLAVAVPMMWLLLPQFGLVGAALALLVSTAVRLILIAGSFPLALRLPLPRLMPVADDFRSLRRALAR